jgi:hypothetical protein
MGRREREVGEGNVKATKMQILCRPQHGLVSKEFHCESSHRKQ